MNPLAISLIQVLVTYGPEAYKAVVDLLHNPNPTQADYLALLQFAQQKSYDDYINAARGTLPVVP
jgi:hypothetical protein